MKKITYALILGIAILISSCVHDGDYKFPASVVPESLSDGWQISTPSNEGIDPKAIEEVYANFFSEDQYYNALSLLFIRNGKLISEGYTRSINFRDKINHVASATKSFTSIAFGIAKKQGYIDDLDTKLYSIFPDKFPNDAAKQSITLKHLLTMKSGLDFDNGNFSIKMYIDKPSDQVKYILEKPLYANPGEEFNYRDCDPNLASHALQKLTGITEEELMRKNLFEPLGITHYYWGKDPEGFTMGAHGLYLIARDMAKIGQLMLNNGNWNGLQILDPEWVKESTSFKTKTPYSTDGNNWDYGYYWWIVNDYNAYTAWGHGGNFIFILPSQNFVAVMASMPDSDEDVVGTKLGGFLKLIKPVLSSMGKQ